MSDYGQIVVGGIVGTIVGAVTAGMFASYVPMSPEVSFLLSMIFGGCFCIAGMLIAVHMLEDSDGGPLA